MISMKDLMKEMRDVHEIQLKNTKETWSRIGKRDSFSELEFNKTDLKSFLKNWTETHGYENTI